MAVFINVKKGKLLELPGIRQEEPKTIYEEARLRKGKAVLILYTSGKLLLQGTPAEVEKLTQELRRRGLGKELPKHAFRQENGWFIGSDEALKGDTFGGMVVAGVKADEALRVKLSQLGVTDSKELDDREILPLAEKIKKEVPCAIRSLLPEEYNLHDHPKKNNVTELLNRLHAEVGRELGPGTHVVDKYPGCLAGNVQEEKAESKYLEVAAASILARAAAVQQLNYLSSLAGFPIPKGSTHVKLALLELKHRGLPPEQFVKMGFGNVKEILGADHK